LFKTMAKQAFHIALLAALLVAAGTASAGSIPRGISSISELLTLKLATRNAPLLASEALGNSVAIATDEATFAGNIDVTANQVIDKAEAVANRTHVKFYIWKTVDSPQAVNKLERDYGFDEEYLQGLNPGVDFDRIREESRILIYRFDPENPGESVGKSNRGRLVNGMPMIDGPYWRVRFHNESWGTPESVSHIVRGLTHVANVMPGGRKVAIGDLSYQSGGYMPPHRSHRSGRDADLAYYSISEASSEDFWNARWSSDLDAERQWELFRYWIDSNIVSYIFVDYQIQKRLYWTALRNGEDKEFLDEVFQYPRWSGGKALIRHIPGHDDHLHVRFRCSAADTRCRR
jgi:murein endopeptidase